MFVTPPAQAGEGRGGLGGFFAGCCCGIRAGTDYNSGKDMHWRDWGPLIPYVGVIFAIWNGIECSQGLTRAEMAAKYGANFY